MFAETKKIKKNAPLIMAVGGNLVLAGIFFQALIFPHSSIDFIFRASLLIFIVEFFSIHSSGMAAKITTNTIRVAGMKMKVSKNEEKIIIMGIYILLVILISITFQNWIVPFFFIISMVTKFFGHKSRAVLASSMLYNFVIFLISILLIILLTEPLKLMFPFPPEVLLKKDPGTSGLFIDAPQTVLFWGVIYFTSLAIMEIALYKKNLKIYS
jgi:hypothetical protein